jgi:predicted transcriptional regulator
MSDQKKKKVKKVSEREQRRIRVLRYVSRHRSMSYRQLAKVLGLSHAAIRAIVVKAGKFQKPSALKPSLYRSKRIDWKTMSNARIAKILKVTPSEVSRARSEYAPETHSPRHDPYKGVDWTKGDAQIAREQKVTPAAVWIARRIRGHKPGIVKK